MLTTQPSGIFLRLIFQCQVAPGSEFILPLLYYHVIYWMFSVYELLRLFTRVKVRLYEGESLIGK